MSLWTVTVAGLFLGLIAMRRLPEQVHEYTVMWVVGAAVVRELDRLDRDPEVDPEWASMFGRRFLPDGRPAATLHLLGKNELAAQARAIDGLTRIGEAGEVVVYSATSTTVRLPRPQ